MIVPQIVLLVIADANPSVKIYPILKGSLATREFPNFCAAIVGGYTLLQLPLRLGYDYLCHLLSSRSIKSDRIRNARNGVSRFVAAFLSAWFGLQILNGSRIKIQKSRACEKDDSSNEANISSEKDLSNGFSGSPENAEFQRTPSLFAGRTIDLTSLAITRALDAAAVVAWKGYKTPCSMKPSKSLMLWGVTRHSDTFVFAISSGVVMWAWFYLPDRLPRTYDKWIGEAAQVDHRLVDLLREAREGRFIYGKDTGHARMLQDMCKDYEWPLEWSDPEKTIPVPCEVVHMGTGPSCHWHAAIRFVRTFKFALATNLPLQLILKARTLSLRTFRKACQDAIRSSAFLSAFVGLFYYGVCLSRTCLGPKFFDQNLVSPITWDSGLCIAAGCALCGWSILIEGRTRRPELAMFVAPRALATFLPRQYDIKVGA